MSMKAYCDYCGQSAPLEQKRTIEVVGGKITIEPQGWHCCDRCFPEVMVIVAQEAAKAPAARSTY